MAFTHGTNARAWIDGYLASTAFSEVGVESKTDDAETSTLGNLFKTFIPGLETAEAKIKGYLDSNSGTPTSTLEYVLENRRRQTVPFTYFPRGGGVQGDVALVLNAFLDEYKINTPVNGATKLELKLQSSNGSPSGIVLAPDSTVTISGNTTSYDQTVVSTTRGAIAAISVSAVSGTTPVLNAKVQHSTDDSVWVDVPGLTFSAQNSINGEYLETAATTTINRYVRVLWTVSGTTPSFTFNVAFRRR